MAECPCFADLLRAGLHRTGFSLATVQRRLEARGNPVSMATLSYWRSGQRRPSRHSREAIEDLEGILRCPPGTLVRAMASGGRAVPLLPAREDWTTWLTAGQAVRDALDELDLADVADDLPVLNAQSVMHIGPEGHPTHIDAQVLYKANRDGVQRCVSVLHYRQPVAERPAFSDLVGLTEGRLISYPELGLFITELLLPRPLRRGETVLASSRSAWPSSVSGRREHWLVTTRVYGEVLIWVTFDPDAVPQHCDTFEETTQTHVEIPVDPTAGSAHLRLRDFGPGRAGIRWGRPRPR